MKYFALIIAFICSIQLPAQNNLRKLNKQEREKYLVKKAKEVVLNFGPAYYREYGTPEISKARKFKREERWEEFAGKRYYTVTLPYDKTKEQLAWSYAAEVDIWEDNGEPQGVMFGYGMGIHFLDTPYKERVERGIKPEEQAPYFCGQECDLIMHFTDSPAYYSNQIKEKRGAVCTLPHRAVLFTEGKPEYYFTFGKATEEHPTRPTFNGGPLLNLQDDFSIVIMGLNSEQKPTPEAYPAERTYDTPISTSYLLSNCGTPCAGQQEKATCLRARHEQMLENHELTQTTNCHRIYIVELPNVKNIEAHNRHTGIPCSKTITDLTAKAAKCYSVEFCKQTACEPLIMLFFINNSNTAIEECVAQIAQYIKFE